MMINILTKFHDFWIKTGIYSGPSLQPHHLFANILTILPFRSNQNDFVKNFAVVMSAIVKRVDCIKCFSII